MIGRVVGALVGREVERRRGESGVRIGIRGAIVGAVAMGAMRRMGPLGLVLGGAYVAKKAMERRRGE